MKIDNVSLAAAESSEAANPFCGKKILDIGCHIGSIALEIAQKYDPLSVVGCDIDSKLIEVAISNMHRVVNNTECTDLINKQHENQ